jgi:hypothetical protein
MHIYVYIYLYLDTGWAVRSSNPERSKILFSPPKVQTGSGAQPTSVYFSGKKRPGRDVNHPSPSRAEVMNERSCTFISFTYLHGVDRDRFIIFIIV